MKIAILTMHYVKNYGAVLQTLATQRLFQHLKHDVYFVDYRRPEYLDSNLFKYYNNDGTHGVVRWLKSSIRYPSIKKRIRVFNDFVNDNINLGSTLYTSIDELRCSPPEADVYCVGSDQVWNSGWNGGFLPAYFLGFGSKDVKRISFSSSIGKDHLDDWEKPLFRDALSIFDSVSVRERSAVDLLRGVGVNASETLDPTLAVEPSIWFELASDRLVDVVDDEYVLLYQLDSDERFADFAASFARERGMKLVRISYWHWELSKDGQSIILPTVEDFLSLIKNASYVFTDSFHGSVFSLLFGVSLVCYYPKMYSARLESLLNMTGTTDRHLHSFDECDFIDRPIDFEKVACRLDVERANTLSYVNSALS